MNKEERKFYADLTDTKSWDKVLGSLSTLKEENRILKENTEHNDKVVDKVIWDNRLLKQALIDIREYVNKQIEFNNSQIQEYKMCIETNENGKFNDEEKDNMEHSMTINICNNYKMKDILQIIDISLNKVRGE